MRNALTVLLCLLLLFGCCGRLSAQGSGFRWVRADARYDALFWGGRQVGVWDRADGVYLPWDGTRWGEATDCPVGPPPGADPAQRVFFGLEKDKIRPGNHYRLNGREVGPEEVRQILQQRPPIAHADQAEVEGGGDKIPDPSQKLRVVVIGNEAERKPVVQALTAGAAADPKSPLRGWAERLIVQAYAPDHWHVARVGYQAGGHPTISVLSADGVELHRQEGWSGEADFAAVLEKIRRPDPDYRPDRTPDLRQPQGPLATLRAWLKRLQVVLGVPWLALALIGGAGVVALLVWARRR
jgi:hypothetical protein